MIFASTIFLFWFLPLALISYYATPKRFRLPVLTTTSLLFYGWWRIDFVALMLLSAIVDYCIGGLLPKVEQPKKRKLLLLLSLTVNLGLLGYFKYAGFGIESFNAILEKFGYEAISWTSVVLPVGISFYTFQSLSYTIDVYRRDVEPIRSFGNFFCYVSMFPQLVAGPIVRFKDIAEQLVDRSHSLKKFAAGALLFQIGFAKKVLLADSVAPLADQGFALVDPSFAEAWMATIAYAFQIYFDFSGYSDMAIGLGLMLGFVYPVNFDSPYRARSITDFWRRWHISLGSWLRDYLYIPLGGNRSGIKRMYLALMLTMLLGGLWHGASWTFVAWGTWQGLWLVLERFFNRRPFYHRAPIMIQIGLTFAIANLGWVFFRATDITQALVFIKAMLGLGGGFVALDQLRISTMVGTGLIAASLLVAFGRPSHRLARSPDWVTAVVVPTSFILALGHLLFQQYRPFLYFQF